MYSKGADASQKAGGTWASGAGRCVLKKCGGGRGQGAGGRGRGSGKEAKSKRKRTGAGGRGQGEGGNRQWEGIRRWKTFSLSVVKEAKSSGNQPGGRSSVGQGTGMPVM